MTTASTAAEFTALAQPHLPRLFHLGLRLTRQPSDSADLVQEALCRAWANWSRFDGRGSIGGYLARIVVNTFISKKRHQRVVDRVHTSFDLADTLHGQSRRRRMDAPDAALIDALSDEVVRALEELPREYRDVVELVDLQSVPYKEAAEALGIPIGTVMSRLHRGRQRLKAALRDYAASYGLAAAC